MANYGKLNENVLLLALLKGDIGARNELVLRYDPLAQKIARKYQCRQLDIEDLIGEARVAVIEALKYWKPTHHIKIRNAIYRNVNRRLTQYARKEQKRGMTEIPMGIFEEDFSESKLGKTQRPRDLARKKPKKRA